jgi:hypothetical protein
MIERHTVTPASFSPSFKDTLRRLSADIAQHFPEDLARDYDHELRMMRLELMLWEHTEPIEMPGGEQPS